MLNRVKIAALKCALINGHVIPFMMGVCSYRINPLGEQVDALCNIVPVVSLGLEDES
jgi:hypothetical protein